MTYYIITIDGPAGSGKSTVAREVAKRLEIFFLDTGALYRSAALAVSMAGMDIHNEEECARVLARTRIQLTTGKVEVNGRDVTEEIRSHRISEMASTIAVHPQVRSILLRIQRSFKESTSLVAEGRDTGSVVFPDADLKIYLDAAPEERARRRHRELSIKGVDIAEEKILGDIEKRDHRDCARALSPLIIPEHAVVVDTTHLNHEEVVERILSLARERLTGLTDQ